MDQPPLLNTQDVRDYFRWVFDEGNEYRRVTNWYRTIAYMGGEDSAWGRWAHKAVNYSGGDSVCRDDFRIMHTGLDGWLEQRKGTFDPRLPYAGQLAFGIGAGLTTAGLAKLALRHKFKMAFTGFVLYNATQLLWDAPVDTPEQALARQQAGRLAEATSSAISALKPLNSWERSDVAAGLDKVYLGSVNRKLGPGGYAEGLSGPLSFALGLWWGRSL